MRHSHMVFLGLALFVAVTMPNYAIGADLGGDVSRLVASIPVIVRYAILVVLVLFISIGILGAWSSLDSEDRLVATLFWLVFCGYGVVNLLGDHKVFDAAATAVVFPIGIAYSLGLMLQLW